MGHSASLNQQYLDNGNMYRNISRSFHKAKSMAFPTV